MPRERIFLTDGTKSTNINNLPEEAWTYLTGGAASDVEQYYKAIPFMRRCIDLRCDNLAALPFAILNEAGDEVDTSEDYQNVVGFLPDPGSTFWMVEAALLTMGRAYLLRQYNYVTTLGLRYLLPTSITPQFEGRGNALSGFVRQRGSIREEYGVEDIVYFWLPDPYVEIGPPRDGKCAAAAAMASCGVLYNMDEFAAAFFKRGAIKPMLLKLGGTPTEQEKVRAKSWWQRVFSGIGNAWATQIVAPDTEVEIIGEGLSELRDTELTTTQREDIATAFGVPMTLLLSTEAGGLGGGGVVESDERKFYQHTVVPAAQFIARVLNEQVMQTSGYTLEFRPETIDVFQADENQRAQALSLYVNSGFSLSVAAQILGIELPADMDYDDLDAMKEERDALAFERQRERVQAFANNRPQDADQEAMRADLRRWRTKARKAGGPVPFESEYIPDAIKASIEGMIAELGVDEAFEFLTVKKKTRTHS